MIVVVALATIRYGGTSGAVYKHGLTKNSAQLKRRNNIVVIS